MIDIFVAVIVVFFIDGKWTKRDLQHMNCLRCSIERLVESLSTKATKYPLTSFPSQDRCRDSEGGKSKIVVFFPLSRVCVLWFS